MIKNQDVTRNIQSVIAEKTALLNHNTQKARSIRQRLIGLEPSIEKTKQIVEELRTFENRELQIPTPIAIKDTRPEELLSYLDERIQTLDDESMEGIPPAAVKKVIKKLFQMVSLDSVLSFGFCFSSLASNIS